MKSALVYTLAGSLVVACSGVTSLGSLPTDGQDSTARDGGSETTTGDNDGDLPMNPTSLGFIEKLTLLACKLLYECPQDDDERDGLRIMFSSAEECAERIPAFWSPEHRGWGGIARLARYVAPLVASGIVKVNQAELDACIATADQCASSVGPCWKLFTGTIEEGAACNINEVCRNGLFCKPSAGGSTCGGTCERQVALGSTCINELDECGPDATCESSPGGGIVCVARPNITIQPVGLGQACDGIVDKRAAPAIFRTCEGGLFCRGKRGAGRTCQPAGTANSPCYERFSDFCVPGHLCLGPDDGLTCQPVALGGLGDECTVMSSRLEVIRPCNPWAGLTCLPDATCGPGGANGQPYLRVLDERACLDGLSPSGPNDTCEPLHPSGDACSQDRQCASDVCASGICREEHCE